MAILDKNLFQRSLSGIVYTAVIIFCTTPWSSSVFGSILPETIKPFHLYFGLIFFLLLVGTWECIRLLQFDSGYEKWLVYPLVLFIFYLFSKRYFYHDFYFNFRLTEILALSLIVIAVVTLFKFKEELSFNSGKLIFSAIYVGLPFSFALGLPKYTSYDATFTLEVFFLFILIWSSDTFAYIVGRLFGKHKMALTISPKKTWEGFAGGVVLTLILSYFIEKYHADLRGNWMVVGFLVAVFAPLGDLVESQLKRTFNVKDSGNIIPGHGGVLDRLDSFILCVPIVYLYFILEKFL